MDHPSPSPGSTARNSLVGTLLAFGLFLAMVTTGLTLMAATEARHEPTATLSTDRPETRRCPDDVRREAEVPSERTCMTLTVNNVGDAAGQARCEITMPEGAEARFHANGFHVYTTEIAAGGTEPLLIYVDGGGGGADLIDSTCGLDQPPKD